MPKNPLSMYMKGVPLPKWSESNHISQKWKKHEAIHPLQPPGQAHRPISTKATGTWLKGTGQEPEINPGVDQTTLKSVGVNTTTARTRPASLVLEALSFFRGNPPQMGGGPLGFSWVLFKATTEGVPMC